MKSGKFFILVLSLLLMAIITPGSVWSEPTEDDPDQDHPWGGETPTDNPGSDVYIVEIGTPLVINLTRIVNLISTDEIKTTATPESETTQTANSIYSLTIKSGLSSVER